MTKTAVVVGATGQIGRATVRRLAEAGWRVTAVSRATRADVAWDPALGVETRLLDRNEDGALAAALGDGRDVLVDCVAYDATHARQLLGLSDRLGSVVAISSAAVYVDAEGYGFDTQEERFPSYPVPVTEDQPIVEPGDTTYANKKATLERLLLEDDRLPATLLRAGAIHGIGSRSPREFFFVKRVLDGRATRVLPYRGESRFHTSGVDNIAELVRCAAERPGDRALNAVDPDAPSVREIAAAIDAHFGVKGDDVLVDGMPDDHIGATPWSTPTPMVLDMTRAETELGYRPVSDYTGALPAYLDWLATTGREHDWQEAFPGLSRALSPHAFDYESEDAWLATH